MGEPIRERSVAEDDREGTLRPSGGMRRQPALSLDLAPCGLDAVAPARVTKGAEADDVVVAKIRGTIAGEDAGAVDRQERGTAVPGLHAGPRLSAVGIQALRVRVAAHDRQCAAHMVAVARELRTARAEQPLAVRRRVALLRVLIERERARRRHDASNQERGCSCSSPHTDDPR
jgi:hypothetical protein